VPLADGLNYAASHMETRVLALLKRIERSRNPNAIQVRPGRKSKKGNAATSTLDRKQKRGVKRRRSKADNELHKVRVYHFIADRFEGLRM
jgi:hypothetical protein